MSDAASTKPPSPDEQLDAVVELARTTTTPLCAASSLGDGVGAVRLDDTCAAEPAPGAPADDGPTEEGIL